MLPCELHQLFDRDIPAGNIIAGLLAVVPTNIYHPLNGKNRLQSGPFMLLQPGNLLDLAAVFPLAVHRVCCDGLALNLQICKHFLKNRNLIRFFMNTFLGPGRHCYWSHMHLKFAGYCENIPALLCYNGNHFPRCSESAMQHIYNSFAYLFPVYHAQHSCECCFRWKFLYSQFF